MLLPVESIYKNRRILLASMHNKEQAIAPAFQQHLGCRLSVEAFDTDQFGTFSGEIERVRSAYDTCVLKAKCAALEKKYALSVASEGSFGPHPANPFLPSAHEIMVFVDLEHDWVISEQYVTTCTNYQSVVIEATTDLTPLLRAMQFPSHALTLHLHPTSALLAKGITSEQQLHECMALGFSQVQQLRLGTDMRAMHNPTRMHTLAELAERLVRRILSACEVCHTPGFGMSGTCGFLPCELCGGPTDRYALEVWSCLQCEFKLEKPRRDGVLSTNATYCPQCNP